MSTPTDSDSNGPRRARLAQVVGAVVVSMVAFALIAVVLALVFPPLVTLGRLVAYFLAMMAVALGLIVANVWAPGRGCASNNEASGAEGNSYEDAGKFAQTFEPKDGYDYDWACDYARQYFEYVHEAIGTIEAKADSIMSYAATFSGFSAAAVIYGAIETHWSLSLAVLPTFVCGAIATCLAVLARRPAAVKFPPEVRKALEYVDAYEDKAQAWFAAQYHWAAIGARAVSDAKAAQVHAATMCLVGAVLCLVFPLVVGVCLKLSGVL